jgi:hypothetical protein
MGFVINKVGKGHQKPEGHYLSKDGVDFQIYEINITGSGNIAIKIWDYIRKEHQVITVCSLEDLVNNIPGATYHEH